MAHLATSSSALPPECSGHLINPLDEHHSPTAMSIPTLTSMTPSSHLLHNPATPSAINTATHNRVWEKSIEQSPSAFGKQADHSITPFLTKHIPSQYHPLGLSSSHNSNSNTKYCYRHRPDLKCRRQANEPSMDQLQKVSSSGCSIMLVKLTISGTSIAHRGGSTRHYPRLVTFLCCTFKTSEPDASGDPRAVLLPSVISNLSLRSGSYQNRFSQRSPFRARFEGTLLLGSNLDLQGGAS